MNNKIKNVLKFKLKNYFLTKVVQNSLLSHTPPELYYLLLVAHHEFVSTGGDLGVEWRRVG
jgi:hypothetical protein